MNRKLRRGAVKRGSTLPAGAGLADQLAEASRQYRQGQFTLARDLCNQILARDPSHIQSLNLLGVIAQASGEHKRAIRNFEKAIALNPADAACHYNIGSSYQALDRRTEAISHFKQAIALGLDGQAIEDFVVQSPIVAPHLDRIAKKWPMPIGYDELFGTAGVAPVANDLFLVCALESVALAGATLEVFLTQLRSALLRLATAGASDKTGADDKVVRLFCALAQQCFLNEYVFAQSDEELTTAASLRDGLLQDLNAGEHLPLLLLTAVAAYFPLYALPAADALLNREWPAMGADLVRQQLAEPLEEARDRKAIPSLTTIEDDVSLQVMRQYEENPYPRWTINPLVAGRAQDRKIGSEAPRAPMDILIAGCGTGEHSVAIAQMFPDARILAVDISLTSLAHARRKTREFGLQNIDYAQADILKLGTVGRSFDHIEAIGVLHHLADPEDGWRVLLSLLRPDGEMRVALYSETARRVIVDARALIAARGFYANPDDIRKCRQEILRDGNSERWKLLSNAKDFYNTSGCRDLLFNVMEHRFTIPKIATFVSGHDLAFLGFDFPEKSSVLEKFQRQFAEPAALTDLDLWQVFEAANPQTFAGMYTFFVRKKK
jgi:ubiquinone/menaquinone biosynthesis C-methylase UbiE